MKHRIVFFTLALVIALNMQLSMIANAQSDERASVILTTAQLTKMGYKSLKKLTYNGKLCDRYEGKTAAKKTYQGIKSRHALPRQNNTYYRFTLIKEVFDSPAHAERRLQQTRPPYAFKTDSVYEKMCALKEGFVVDRTVYFVATDAYLFNQELPNVLTQLKSYFINKSPSKRNNNNKTTMTTSTDFSSLAQKITFLEQYVRFRRHYLQLDFFIAYHDNATGRLAAPSDWDIQIIARVPQHELEQWITDLQPMQKAPVVIWLKRIPTKIDLTDLSEWFQQGGRVVGIDRKQQIVVYRNTTMK